MSNVEKKVDAIKDCETCGLRLICRNRTYAAYEDHPEKTVLQWQNAVGGAHYKWIGPEKYKCVDADGKDILPKKKEETPTSNTINEGDAAGKIPKVGNGLVQNDLMKDDETPTATVIRPATKTPKLQPLDEGTTKVIRNDAILLYKTRQVIIDTVAEFEKDAHPGMIWEMTALIYNKHFGEKKL